MSLTSEREPEKRKRRGNFAPSFTGKKLFRLCLVFFLGLSFLGVANLALRHATKGRTLLSFPN